MENRNSDCLESRIIENAKELFIERGFAETSMSDIAARTGINRPVLHYYFRTKDRMFQAVVGSIVETFIPQVQDVISCREKSVKVRLGLLVDVYYGIFKTHPTLPIFMMREMNRDYAHFEKTIFEQRIDRYFIAIKQVLKTEMDRGVIRQIPFRFLFMTFYSLLVMPFCVKPLCENVFMETGETYEKVLADWKEYLIENMAKFLSVDENAERKP